MTRISNARPTVVVTGLQLIAIAGSWLALVGLATGIFFAPRGAEVQPALDDAVGFGFSTAIGGATAASAAFVIGGRKRWAVQLALSVLLVSAILAIVLGYFLWLDPTFVRLRMDPWSLQHLQHAVPLWGKQIAGYHGPLGAAVGMTLGTTAGLLIRFGQRRPRLAMGVVLAILFVFASGSGQHFALDLVRGTGRLLRFFLIPWSISDDQISILGIILGALVGAVVADLAMYVTRHGGGATASGQTSP